MATLSINEILGRTLAPIVTPGKYENVTIAKTELFPKSETNKQEYLRVTMKTEDGREISDNRFAQGLNIMISHLREQLGLQEQELNVSDLFTPGKFKFTIWVERAQVMNNSGKQVRVTNVHFLEPLAKPETAVSTNSSDASSADLDDELPE